MKAQDNNSMLVLFVWDLACNVLRHHTIMIFNAVDTSLTARLTALSDMWDKPAGV